MGTVKRTILIALSAVGVLAAVGSVGVLYKYHEATKIDRSATTVVVRQYIDELLVRRDDVRAALFACGDQSDLAAIKALRDQLVREEKANSVSTQVVPASLVEEGANVVVVDLKLNQGQGLHVDRRSQRWRFGLKDEDGWRVCSAEQLPDPTPSPSPSPSTPPTAG